MLQKPLPVWGWAIGAMLVIAVILLGYRTMEAERKLKAAQLDIHSAIGNGIMAKSDVAEQLRLELDSSEREIQRLNEIVARAEEKTREYENQIALLRQGKARCEEFFDGWDVKASPAHVVTLLALRVRLAQQRIASIRASPPLLASIGQVCSPKSERSGHR